MKTACSTGTTTCTSHLSEPGSAAEDRDFNLLASHVRNAFGASVPLFATDATGLYDAFLSGIPAGRRQHYQCRACRKFVESYGGLVTIDEAGKTHSPLWDGNSWPFPAFFAEALCRVEKLVYTARVRGVFLSSEQMWGLPENACKKPPWRWEHLHALPSHVFYDSLLSADQAAAEKLQDFEMLTRSFDVFDNRTAQRAVELLSTGALYRSEKCLQVAQWYSDLASALFSLRKVPSAAGQHANLRWRAVATAPKGYCHVRSSMIGTLLADIEVKVPFEELKRRFDEKMSPLQYQRPTAAPSEGQLDAAERLVEKLGLQRSLERRYARLTEVTPYAIWTPRLARSGPQPPSPQVDSVFGHLRVRPSVRASDQPAVVMTFDKFRRTVLPQCVRLEFLVPRWSAPFFGFLTAVDPSAPPILQWDDPALRNPVSWYVYGHGSDAGVWGLVPARYVNVTALTLQPNTWRSSVHTHHGNGAFFVLDGAHDRLHPTGLCLFPEILRSEFHAVRKSMEAYSASKKLLGAADGNACGICFKEGQAFGLPEFRVTSGGSTLLYKLDRWD